MRNKYNAMKLFIVKQVYVVKQTRPGFHASLVIIVCVSIDVLPKRQLDFISIRFLAIILVLNMGLAHFARCTGNADTTIYNHLRMNCAVKLFGVCSRGQGCSDGGKEGQCSGRQITGAPNQWWGSEKSQQRRKYFLQCSTFASEGP